MKKIKVMHVIDKLSVDGCGVHGVTMALLAWITNADQDQFSFEVVILRAEEEAREYFESRDIPIYFMNRSKIDPRTLLDLLKLIHITTPNVLHLHGFGAANFGRLASFITRTPNVVHEHAVLTGQPFYQSIADLLLSPLTNKAVAVAKNVAEYMVKGRRISNKKIEVIYNGIDTNEFSIPNKEIINKERKELGIDKDLKILCNVGRLSIVKGHVYLLEAAAKIFELKKNVRLLIVGEGPERENLEKMCENLNISDKVIFAGFRKDVAIFLAMSDIFVLTSIVEGGPISLLEAMNLGKGIVAFSSGGITDALEDGKHAFIIPSINVDTLVSKIMYLLENPTVMNSLGENARNKCAEFDIKFVVNKISRVYKDLV